MLDISEKIFCHVDLTSNEIAARRRAIRTEEIMGARSTNQYTPDFVSPPGETLKEILEERGISQAELAERLGHTPKMINEIIKGKAPILEETALRLENVLDVPARFWNNRERNYGEYLAKQEDLYNKIF